MKQATRMFFASVAASSIMSIVPAQASSSSSMKVLLASQITDYHHASLSQTKNIELVARRLNGVVVPPHGTFSYYRTVGPYTAANGYHWGRAFSGDRIVPSMGGGVCQGASTLYAAILRTGLKVTERYQHSLTVPYLPAGEDATVTGTFKNFRFLNNRSTPIRISAAADTSIRKMTVAVYGTEAAPKIVVRHKVLHTTPYPIKRKFNKALATGESKVIFPGQNGVKVHTWVETTRADGKKTVKDLGIDTYLPSPRIIEYGSQDKTGPVRVPHGAGGK